MFQDISEVGWKMVDVEKWMFRDLWTRQVKQNQRIKEILIETIFYFREYLFFSNKPISLYITTNALG